MDLTVERGEVVALLGPNGAGKTTLLRLLATDLVPEKGRLELLGDPVVPPTAALRRRLGIVDQETVHVEALTGRENALLFAEAALEPPAARASVEPLLASFRLGEDAHLPVARYSFGMRRKLLLVEALARRPDLLLMDEPTVGLDPSGREAFREALEERSRRGTAVVLATNEVAEAERLAHRVVFLHRGRVVADEPPATLLGRLERRTEIEVELAGPAPPIPDPLPGVEEAEVRAGRLLARSSRGSAVLPELLGALLEAGGRLSRVSVREPDLADVFRLLTGEPLPRRETAAPEETGPPDGDGG